MRYLPLALLLAACADAGSPSRAPALERIGTFLWPVFVTSPPADSSRIFIAQRSGMIRVRSGTTLLPTPFLDLSSKIPSTLELGMFSMAFHPQYAANGWFYVFYTNAQSDLRIVRYTVSANPNVADEATADTVLKVAHGRENHHGGQLQFGPDGKLYIAIGDGGCCGDPNGHAQDMHTLLGKLLRIDVDTATGYRIPSDNPFASDTSAEPEIWASGLRNPWRFSFDRETGDLYIGDVGQDQWEEVDVAPAPGLGKGASYGWNTMEGTHCYLASPCSSTGLTPPAYEYQHSSGGACNVQGGYVYRGSVVTQLTGRYLFADYCSGVVSSFVYSGGAVSDVRNWPSLTPPTQGIVSFGQDSRGELYLTTYLGDVYRIVNGR